MNAIRSSHGEARCAELVCCARDLLVEGGLDGFAMRTVAARVGMRVGNLQYYFPTRDDLLEEVIRAEFAHDLATLRATKSADDGVVDFGRLARRLVGNWCSDSGGVFLMLSSLAFHNDQFQALNHQIYEAFHTEIGDLIRQIDPQADTDEVTTRAQLVTAVLDGVALQAHAAAAEAKVDALLDRATQLVQTIAVGTGDGAPGR